MMVNDTKGPPMDPAIAREVITSMNQRHHQCLWRHRITAISPASILFLLRWFVLDFYPCRSRPHHHHCEAYIITLPQSSRDNSHIQYQRRCSIIRTRVSTSSLFATEALSKSGGESISSSSHCRVRQDGDEFDVAPSTAYQLKNLTHHINDAYIIQWRGEGTEGYSDALRQLEFTSAFRAEMKDYLHHSIHRHFNYEDYDIQFHFQNALSYSGPILDHGDLLSSSSSSTTTTSTPLPPTESSSCDDNTSNPAAEFQGQSSNIPHLLQVQAYESAMQYVSISLRHRPFMNACTVDAAGPGTMPGVLVENVEVSSSPIVHEIFINAIHRCSLIRTAFQIVAGGMGSTDEYSYEELAAEALENKSFDDMILYDATWSIRLRRYGPMELLDCTKQQKQQPPFSNKRPPQQARYGKNVRSPLTDERLAILSMAELVKLFRGRVKLKNPMCSIYLLEGLQPNRRSWTGNCDEQEDTIASIGKCNAVEERSSSSKLLARVVAKGPKTSIYAPNTRICITTTPLCPIASFTLCNIAQLQRHGQFTILDPFAGSCATLLAASHIASLPATSTLFNSTFKEQHLNSSRGGRGGCRSVAIEVAHNGYVNRDDIVQDFVHRSLPPPVEIIRGNCFSPEVRHRARQAIGGGAFDAIVTDPPYGIREAITGSLEQRMEDDETTFSPLTELLHAMGHDRLDAGTPLLKSGGRLVAFIPVRRKEECIEDCLPDSCAMEAAGLVMEGEPREQVLSDILSRWLVSFVAV